MKKLLLSIAILLSAGSLFAQLAIQPNPYLIGTYPKPTTDPKQVTNHVMDFDSIISVYYDRSSSFSFIGYQSAMDSTARGYVFGSIFQNLGNGKEALNDATAMHFDWTGGDATVIEVDIAAKAKIIVGTADSLVVRIYSLNVDSSANQILGEGKVSTDDLDTTGHFTPVYLTANLTTSFLVSLEFIGMDDTLGFISNNYTAGDGMHEKRARYLLSSNFYTVLPVLGINYPSPWCSIEQLFQDLGSPTDLDCDMLIIPTVSVNTGMKHFDNSVFTLEPIYPSPSKDKISLDYTLKSASKVSYSIMNDMGKVVYSENFGTQVAGRNTKTIDISKYAAGPYFFTFNVDGKPLTQKFTVVK